MAAVHGRGLLNTNVSTATALLVWTMMDTQFNGKPSIVGAINGMIAGLVGITPAAGYVDGWGALIIGDRRAGQSRHASLHRHRQGRARHQRDGLVLWQFHAAQIPGAMRALYHRA